MKSEIYNISRIYLLDNEQGKEKIYEIINKSTPKHIKKLFSKETFVEAPYGVYEFYIDKYTLELMYYLDQIHNFLELIEDTVLDKASHLQTIADNNIYRYIITIPQKDNNIRFVILYRDSKSKPPTIVVDVIINRESFTQQCYKELKRIYEKNKYFISKEYEEKCAKENAILYQEYVIKNIYETSQFLKKYLKNSNVRNCHR